MYRLPEDEFVDVSGEHGAGGEHGGVGRAHDGRGNRAQAEEGDVRWGQMLQNLRKFIVYKVLTLNSYHGQDHPGVVGVVQVAVGVQHTREIRLTPICRMENVTFRRGRAYFCAPFLL